jgi:hypothetical protein
MVKMNRIAHRVSKLKDDMRFLSDGCLLISYSKNEIQEPKLHRMKYTTIILSENESYLSSTQFLK